MGWWRRRSADDQLSGERDVMGIGLFARGQPQRGAQSDAAHLSQRLADCGERR